MTNVTTSVYWNIKSEMSNLMMLQVHFNSQKNPPRALHDSTELTCAAGYMQANFC